MGWLDVAAIICVGKEQTALLDAAGATMAEWKSVCVEASALTATCCKELLQLQKPFAVAFMKSMATFVRTVAMTKNLEVSTTKYDHLR